jgi:hypothetical protein
MEMFMVALLPVCLSLIVCDAVAFDSLEGKPSILGVMHVIRCGSFPALSPRFAVFAELTNGRGDVDLEFATLLSGTESAEMILAASDRMQLTFADPLDVRIAGTHVDQLLLRGPGEIVVRMSAGATVIMERRVRILRTPPGRPEP